VPSPVDIAKGSAETALMRILGEALDGLGRWYIAIPPALLVGFLVGLFLLATAGQTRLEVANERVRISQSREQALGEFLSLLTEAEAAQRGYLLTAQENYLVPYSEAMPKIVPELDKLRDSFQGSDSAVELRAMLRVLTGKKLGELESSVALAKSAGTKRALELVRTDIGQRDMQEIRGIVAQLHGEIDNELNAATARLHSDLSLARWLTAAGAMLNLVLVVLASRLVYVDMRRRARQAQSLREQKLELEHQVHDRTRELDALSTHLQELSEQEKSALARELHDELGGLLVSARMDLSWLQQHLPSTDTVILQRFKRIHETLSAGVNLKRRVVEELRPTLLDNMGLFSALRWQLKETCGRGGLHCTERYPEAELPFAPHAAIGIFRMAQEAMMNILKHAGAKNVDFNVEVLDGALIIQISDDGRGIAAPRITSLGSHGLASMRHRIAVLGGHWDIRSPRVGGTVLTASIPLANNVLAEANGFPEGLAAPA
jgi:signal transduction histidine kinase